MTRYARTVARWGLRAMLVAVLGIALVALVFLTVLPRATHGAALTVLSGSMTPTFRTGSVVLIRPVDPATLRVGDVVTYQRRPGVAEYVTHRIVAVDTATTPVSFTTKGDANRGPDLDPVPASAVRGRAWFAVPYLGTLRQLAGNRSLALLVVVVGLSGYAVAQFVGGLRDLLRRGGSRPVPAASDGGADG